MPEIIWEDKTDYREPQWQGMARHIDQDSHASIVIERREAWRNVTDKGEPTLVVRQTQMLQGENKHSGKQWSRWKTISVTWIKARHDGAWEVRTRNAIGRWHTRLVFAHDETLAYLIPAEVDDRLPKPIEVTDYYPLYDHYTKGTIYPRESTPHEVWRALRLTDDVGEITRRLFGKSRYRRDLVRAVATANINGLVTGWMFRGLCPMDWIIPKIDVGHTPVNIRPLLRRLDQQSLKNLLGDGMNTWQVADIHRAMNLATVQPFLTGEMEIPRQRTWRGFHDFLYGHERANRHLVQVVNNRTLLKPKEPMELTEFESSLVDTFGEFDIKIANHEDTLREWGDEMSNCIDGYGWQMRNHSSILGGVYRGERLIGNFEITHTRSTEPGYRLQQLLGRFNDPLPDATRFILEAFLASKGVTVDGYWGDARPVDMDMVGLAIAEPVF